MPITFSLPIYFINSFTMEEPNFPFAAVTAIFILCILMFVKRPALYKLLVKYCNELVHKLIDYFLLSQSNLLKKAM